MKKITMFTMVSCPYCKEAIRLMDKLFEQNPKYRDIPLVKIDEVKNPDIANQYDYYFVPTYYIGDRKIHEGAANAEIIKSVFDEALE